MAMDTEKTRRRVWLIEHDIIGANKLPRATNVDSKSKDVTTIHSIGVWVLDFEGRDAGAESVETFLVMCCLLCSI